MVTAVYLFFAAEKFSIFFSRAEGTTFDSCEKNTVPFSDRQRTDRCLCPHIYGIKQTAGQTLPISNFRRFRHIPKPLGEVFQTSAGLEPAIPLGLLPISILNSDFSAALAYTLEFPRAPQCVHTLAICNLCIQYTGIFFIYHGKKVANSISVRNFFAIFSRSTIRLTK